MVSVQAPLSPNQRRAIPEPKNPSRKRKWEGLPFDYEEQVFEKRSKAESKNFMSDIELHLETPLPSEWQRCLDIQSGKIHFYNTKTQTRTSMDPRETRSPSPETPSPSERNMISLDLELNLTRSESSPIRKTEEQCFSKLTNPKGNSTSTSTTTLADNDLSNSVDFSRKKKITSTSWPSWLAFETADQQEMVATVLSFVPELQVHALIRNKAPQTLIFRSDCNFLCHNKDQKLGSSLGIYDHHR
ncbi:WW domain containing protein [Parasponia andersonii]|uniref:WW domain containing protein n=1 Tax=Parasponia andersonii TaxID=3476 RepID=A0A2P5CKQ1_PARAD|nr:WW domain containing protein [Parasponia andersonii]